MATSNTAVQFLTYVRQELPFPLFSVQVNGGSKFMGKFETFCAELHIPLFVIPPHSPQYNGTVERGNCTDRYEFYRLYDGSFSLSTLRPVLRKVRHPRPRRWLDECGRLKGDWLNSLC